MNRDYSNVSGSHTYNLFFIGIPKNNIPAENLIDSAHPIEVISESNHVFELNLEKFKNILEAEDIKNRHVVVVSIAGPFRSGKSFLLNVFLRYLYAQVFRQIESNLYLE